MAADAVGLFGTGLPVGEVQYTDGTHFVTVCRRNTVNIGLAGGPAEVAHRASALTGVQPAPHRIGGHALPLYALGGLRLEVVVGTAGACVGLAIHDIVVRGSVTVVILAVAVLRGTGVDGLVGVVAVSTAQGTHNGGSHQLQGGIAVPVPVVIAPLIGDTVAVVVQIVALLGLGFGSCTTGPSQGTLTGLFPGARPVLVGDAARSIRSIQLCRAHTACCVRHALFG